MCRVCLRGLCHWIVWDCASMLSLGLKKMVWKCGVCDVLRWDFGREGTWMDDNYF
jgi:hypothetical protein